jgi:DNA polymerase-4
MNDEKNEGPMDNLAPQRKIIHVDMDAFFASVEQRDQPQYLGKPLIVGGNPNERGVVAACSYEARQFGIHSAMPCSTAYRLCPEAIFVPHRFDVYREVSQQIRAIFWRYASEVEPLSLDEAYLDVTGADYFNGSATYIAQAIKRDITAETRLIASAGVSYNKFLAKLASDMDKPNGLYVIRPEQGPDFVARLAIGKFHGIGPATEAKMHRVGVETGQDLLQWSEAALVEQFGKSGRYFYHIARGIDERPVQSTRQRKSIGKETTFQQDIRSLIELRGHLDQLAQQVWETLQRLKFTARTLTVKVKYADFQQVTRSQTIETGLDLQMINSLLPELLSKTEAGQSAVRLIGIAVSGFDQPKPEQVVSQQLDLGLNDAF